MTLVFEGKAAPGGGFGVGVLTLEGDRTATLVIDGAFGEREAALSPDGQRFLFLADATETADGEAAEPQILLVQNWFEELRRLVPVN